MMNGNDAGMSWWYVVGLLVLMAILIWILAKAMRQSKNNDQRLESSSLDLLREKNPNEVKAVDEQQENLT